MKKVKSIIILFVLLSTNLIFAQQGVYNNKNIIAVNSENYIDFIPIQPIKLSSKYETLSSDNELINKSLVEMSADKNAVIKFLPNESLSTVIQQFDSNGNVTYIYSGRTLKKGTYRVTIDYGKYVIEKVKDSADTCLGYMKIGVGIRVVANIKAIKNKVNIGSILSLGAAAEKGEIVGNIGYRVIGIESEDITPIFPLNPDLSPTIHEEYFKALQAIRDLIYNKNIRLYPQAIAYKQSECNLTNLTRKLIGIHN